MSNEWQVRIQYEIGMIGYALYMYRKNYDGTVDYKTLSGDIKVAQNKKVDKPLYLFVFESRSQLRQLMEQAEKQGVQAPSTDNALGRLEATERHLQDLRLLIPRLTPIVKADK